MADLAQRTFKDDDGVELSVAWGIFVPDKYVVSFGVTTPPGDHTKDTNYLAWYTRDGGFLVTVGLQTREEVEALIKMLQIALGEA